MLTPFRLQDSLGPFLFPALLSPPLPRDFQPLPTLLCSGLRFPEIANYLHLCSAQARVPEIANNHYPCSAQASASPRLVPWVFIRRCMRAVSSSNTSPRINRAYLEWERAGVWQLLDEMTKWLCSIGWIGPFPIHTSLWPVSLPDRSSSGCASFPFTRFVSSKWAWPICWPTYPAFGPSSKWFRTVIWWILVCITLSEQLLKFVKASGTPERIMIADASNQSNTCDIMIFHPWISTPVTSRIVQVIRIDVRPYHLASRESHRTKVCIVLRCGIRVKANISIWLDISLPF